MGNSGHDNVRRQNRLALEPPRRHTLPEAPAPPTLPPLDPPLRSKEILSHSAPFLFYPDLTLLWITGTGGGTASSIKWRSHGAESVIANC